MGCEYLSNDNRTIDMGVAHELKMNLSHKIKRFECFYFMNSVWVDCFSRFKKGNFELNELPRSGRPMELDVDLLKQLIEEDPRLTVRCLAEQLGALILRWKNI
jgi:hypothetical protein